jgi:anti-sigma-K factor RskA
MNYGHPELRDRLAAEYALGTLRGPARRRFERLLAGDPELRDLVQAWEMRVNLLAESAPAVPPPDHLWQRISQRIGPAPERRSLLDRLWESLGFWRGVSLAAAAAAAALALYIALAPTPVPPGPSYIAVLIDADRTPILLARFDAGTRQLSVRRLQPAPSDPAHAHELWLVAGSTAPRSLGLLGGDETIVDLPPDQAAALVNAVLAISLEPPGGSPTGTPTEVTFTGAVVPADL